MGHILRWKESVDFDATAFRWNHFVLAGDLKNTRMEARGNIQGDCEGLGSNMMLAADPRTAETRRVFVGSQNCEMTGMVTTPGMRTMFINVQHPSEFPTDRGDPNQPDKYSTRPSGQEGARSRSATVIIRKNNGGAIGSRRYELGIFRRAA